MRYDRVETRSAVPLVAHILSSVRVVEPCTDHHSSRLMMIYGRHKVKTVALAQFISNTYFSHRSSQHSIQDEKKKSRFVRPQTLLPIDDRPRPDQSTFPIPSCETEDQSDDDDDGDGDSDATHLSHCNPIRSVPCSNLPTSSPSMDIRSICCRRRLEPTF
jgi:hypothetical protein